LTFCYYNIVVSLDILYISSMTVRVVEDDIFFSGGGIVVGYRQLNFII